MRAKRYGLEIVLAAFFVLLLVPAAEAILPVGTEFSFTSAGLFDPQALSTSGTTSFTYPHTLADGDFWGGEFYGDTWTGLEGGEVIEISGAELGVIGFTFGDPSGKFTLAAWFEGISLGQMEYAGGDWLGAWEVSLTEAAIEVLETNRTGLITLEIAGIDNLGGGSVTLLTTSIGGEGMVITPEPASLLLLGGGLLALLGLGGKKKEEEI